MKLNLITPTVLVTALLAGCQGMPARTAAPVAAPARVETAPPLPAVPLTADVLYFLLLGEIAGHRGQLDVSVGSLSRAASKTRDPRLAERATQAALYARRPKEALASANLWVELRPDSSDANEALAAAYLENGDADAALKSYEKFLSLGSEDALAQTFLKISAALGRQTNRTAALDLMRALVQKHADKPAPHFALAHLAVRVSDLDVAMRAIDQALKLSPAWEDAALFKARVLVSLKDMRAALNYHEHYLDMYPRANNMRVSYARLLVDQKMWDKARVQFKRVASTSPSDADATFTVALLALQSNELNEAEIYLRRTLELQPENDQARLYLGQVFEQRKQYDEAIHWYGLVESAEHLFEAQARLGVALARQGKVAQARHHLHGLTPKSEAQKVQLTLAEEQILRDAQQFEEAFQVLSRVLGDLPNNADLLYARALVAEKLNRVEVAEQDLRRILKKDAKNANALNALGYTLADRTTRYTEALALIEEALALKPDDPFILDSLGWVHYRLGNYTEAIKYLRLALDKRPDAEIAAHLGEVLWVTGDRSGAESVWKSALQQAPESEVLLGVMRRFQP